MPNQPTSFTDELGAAARGVGAIVVGDRRAASYFDFSLRGLAGSFIAFLVAITINAYLPALTGPGMDGTQAQLSSGLALVLSALLYGVQAGVALLVLRQLKRQDGFVPYLVADNWASFYVTAASALLRLVGVNDTVNLVFFGLLLLVVEINTARLVVTLKPRQIAAFLVLQTIAVSVCFFLLASILVPVGPDAITPP